MNKNNLIFGTGFNENPKKFSKRKFINSINYCLKKDINFFDTADNYFDGEIQKIIGKFTYNKKIKIINKFKLLNDKKKLNENLENSLRSLKTECIDFYMPHWPTYNMNLNLLADFAEENLDRKRIKFFGLSNFNLEMIKKFKKIYKKKIFIQNEINLCNFYYNKKLIDFCKQNNIGIFAYKISDNFFLEKKMDYLKNSYSNYEISLMWIKTLNINPIIKSLNLINLKKNITTFKGAKKINLSLKNNYVSIPINKINKISSGSNVVYNSLNEAKKNKKNLYPSPIDISKEIKKFGLLKPFFIKKRQKGYELLSGQARFWAYLILKKRKFFKAILVK
jgi:aryl-alcohol dehydrogenase-like predicted oxidoreductase